MSRRDEETAVLDLRGLKCPLPVLKTRRRLAGMAPGARLRVEATDPMSAIDVPHMCREDGHALREEHRDGAVLTFVIERGPQPIRPENPEMDSGLSDSAA